MSRPSGEDFDGDDVALNALVQADVDGARDAAAYYGSEIGVANEVARALSTHFGRAVNGRAIYDRLP